MKYLSFNLITAALIFILNPTPAYAQKACKILFSTQKNSSKPEINSSFAYQTKTTNLEDYFRSQNINGISSSYSFWGQPSLSKSNYKSAVEALRNTELSPENLQKIHRELTQGQSVLKFRDTREARVIGDYSFKGNSLLSRTEIEIINSNPFLVFKISEEAQSIGVADRSSHFIGDIYFPSAANTEKFIKLLSDETQKKLKTPPPAKSALEAKLNTQILKELLEWTLHDAEEKLNQHGSEVPVILAELEWRIKSLGLYYEPIYKINGRNIESAFTGLVKNRSFELAEATVDAFILKHNLAASAQALNRGFKPRLTDDFSIWVQYMKDHVEGVAQSKVNKLVTHLEKMHAELTDAESDMFKTYYTSLLMTGLNLETNSAEIIFNNYKNFKQKHTLPLAEKQNEVRLIPIEFIENFGKLPKSYQHYYSQYYFADKSTFRGVSNPSRLTDSQLAEYFYSFKGRLASDMARSDFNRRLELAKLSMLKFNRDLIDGRTVETVTQHAAKHMAYDSPNTAKTYYVSTTDLNTVAFRFAVDKGYITRSSANKNGNTHFVIESLVPVSGKIDFSTFKQTEAMWKNHFPRQKETAVAGGIDPNSVIRIYVLEPYAENEKRPSSGPEKHGRIVRILERDFNRPHVILIKEKTETGEFLVINEINCAMTASEVK